MKTDVQYDAGILKELSRGEFCSWLS